MFLEKLNNLISTKKTELDISNYKIESCKNELISEQSKLEDLKKQIEYHTIASTFLQSIIETVCDKNIKLIEDFVNISLKSIFTDQELTFTIAKSIKRNVNTYSFIIYKDGIEGSINSYGGGVLCVISLVLKVMFLKLTKAPNILVLDESLSFLSNNYIDNCSNYIKSLTSDFGINLILVTHQSGFKSFADNIYHAESFDNKTIFKKVCL